VVSSTQGATRELDLPVDGSRIIGDLWRVRLTRDDVELSAVVKWMHAKGVTSSHMYATAAAHVAA
jgi:hypothetical protein